MGDLLRPCGPPPVSADGRFAPSPTGVLHLGNLRTALAAWVLARSAGGRFLVRIEDLDPGRSREQLIDGQLRDLAAIGIDWDEPPVRQSTRSAHYAAALGALEERGLLYECWCTRAEIRQATAAPHGDQPGGAYPGTCARLSAGERRKRRGTGRPPALRVRATGTQLTFADRLRGVVVCVVDDFVVRRNDGAYAYNLAVVVDDAEQSIGEVVRGADLLAGTGRQIWLQQALGLPTPGYAHVALLTGPDGERLAKRHRAITLAEQLERGATPALVRNELAAQLGLIGPGSHAEPADLLESARAMTKTTETSR